MDNSIIKKKLINKQNREATIKHYVLGYILECAVKNNTGITTKIMDFLAYELKVITDENFITCLLRARVYRLALINNVKCSYKMLKRKIEIASYNESDQKEIIRKLQHFANNFENGIFVNSNMGKSSFVNEWFNK